MLLLRTSLPVPEPSCSPGLAAGAGEPAVVETLVLAAWCEQTSSGGLLLGC